MLIGILILALFLQNNPFATDAAPEYVVKQYTIADGLPLNAVQRMVQAKDGFLYITTYDGLVRYDGYEFTTMNMLNAPGLSTNRLRSIGIDSDGIIWVASPYGNVSAFDGFTFTNHDQTSLTDLPHFSGSDEIAHQIDRLGTKKGAILPFMQDFDLRVSGNTVYFDSVSVSINGQFVIENQELRGGFEDHEGTIWIFTRNNGMFQIKESKVRNFNGSDDFRFRNTYSIVQKSPQELLVQGFPRFTLNIDLETSAVENLFFFDEANHDAQYLFVNPVDQTVYASTESFPLFELKSNRWVQADWLDSLEFLPQTIVTGMYKTSDHILFVGSTDGLIVRKDGAVFRIEDKTGQQINRARAFLSLPDGSLLIGTNGNGLFRVNTSDWSYKRYVTDDGIASNFVRDIHSTSNDTIWLATQDRGLNRIVFNPEGEIVETISVGTSDGLLNHGLHRIIADPHGYLWVNSNGGIMRFSEQNLNAFANRETSQLLILKLTDEQGLRNNEGNGGVSNSGTLLDNGLIVFPNQVGLVIINPDEFLNIGADNLSQPVIDRVSFNDQSLQAGLFESIALPLGERDFRVSFTLPNFRNPDMITFSYQLEGLQRTWRRPVSGRTAVFTNVPPGEYLLRVRVTGPDGTPVFASMPVVVPPFFYETIWFYLLCGFLFLGALAFIHRYRTEQLRLKELRTRSLLELQTCYVIRTDLAGNYTYANPKFLETFGFLYKKDEGGPIPYSGINCMSSIHSEDQPKVVETIAELMQNPGKVIQVDMRKPLEDGSYAYTLWDFSIIFKPNGKPGEVQCVGIDYTDRKKQERLLKESEHKLQRTIESVPHPLVIIGEDLEIEFVNEEFERVIGYTEEEILHTDVTKLLPDADSKARARRLWSYLRASSRAKKVPGFITVKTKSGGELSVFLSLNHFIAGDKKLSILILQDVTELKMRQDVILKQNKTLRDIAWHQSHVVRRPVANILGVVDLIQNYPEETLSQQAELLDMLKETTRELDEIVKDLVRKSNESEFAEDASDDSLKSG
ncbi:PAS domain S-box-containing protein [Cyclonatronum proteinivorum]|uniref:histidine kinase n=1 Tax=Cyclonatronum proteinivorum TaxID=1457365 RepID=A0A345UJQ9_9BACT|nr:PAS domain S-box protein [Cyclonatronum proteinivorum]AXJ00711.1 PAS domain S-box-containing protein [Cyclonatronum proteinivorum]